jgi:hypothetical protein
MTPSRPAVRQGPQEVNDHEDYDSCHHYGVSIGIGSAFADNGDGYSATTLFTSIPGEQPSLTAAAPGRVATASLNGTVARGYLTTSRSSTRLFPPAQDGGEH